MRIPITSPVGKWWVVAGVDGGLYVTDGDEPIVTGVVAGVEVITNFFGPWLKTMYLRIVLFQPLHMRKAHYSLRLMNS